MREWAWVGGGGRHWVSQVALTPQRSHPSPTHPSSTCAPVPAAHVAPAAPWPGLAAGRWPAAGRPTRQGHAPLPPAGRASSEWGQADGWPEYSSRGVDWPAAGRQRAAARRSKGKAGSRGRPHVALSTHQRRQRLHHEQERGGPRGHIPHPPAAAWQPAGAVGGSQAQKQGQRHSGRAPAGGGQSRRLPPGGRQHKRQVGHLRGCGMGQSAPLALRCGGGITAAVQGMHICPISPAAPWPSPRRR